MKNTLKVTTPTDREVVMTRTFDAPRAMVFKAMTTPELIKRWLFQPPGWSMTACEEDIRVGGKYRWAWAGPDGQAMVVSGVYSEVVPPERLARTEQFDMGCNTPMGEQQTKFVFTEQGGKTLLTLTVLFPNKEARDGMIASGMEQGVSAGYDKMDEMLAAGIK
jgi:uncharacterized protein YndB with AHSA1/START domain